ncbi:MAG: DUF4838 domain-containing protein [Clostridia bacterium]|nr:DUF4838 domain-containing protein [Clostridia bacterium]
MKPLTKPLCLLLLALTCLSPLSACDGGGGAVTDTPTHTDTPAQSSPAQDTESPSLPETESPTVTEPDTAPPAPEQGVRIGGTDLSAFTVIRSADMPEGQVTALEFFVEQIKEATGVALPILIDSDDQAVEHEVVIGTTNRQNAALTRAIGEIRDDGYAMVVDGGDLYIGATTGRGVVYGMAALLEDYFGVRFYARDYICHRPLGAVSLEEGFKEVFSPEFHARRTWVDGLYADPLEQVLFLRNNSDGLKKAKVGDTYPIRANSNHTIHDLAKSDGQVPCLTDEAVYRQVLKSVVKKLNNNPDQNVIQVGQTDGGQPCKCERCAAIHKEYGTDNATWFLFLNRLADECASLYPDRGVKLITYAYQYTHGVPQNGYTVSDNVIINFCFDKACCNHAFDHPDCPKNTPVAAELREWAKLCKAENLYVYEYAYNCGDNYLPDPSLFVMWENFQFYLECGVNGILSEGITARGGEFDSLRAYLRSKLVWNPRMTEEEFNTLMEEFLAGYYGDAAPYMAEYLKLLCDGERVSCTDMYTPMYTFYQTVEQRGSTAVSQELLDQCQELFDKAFAVETLTEAQREHLECTSIHLLMVRYSYFPKGDRNEKKELYDTIIAWREKYGV